MPNRDTSTQPRDLLDTPAAARRLGLQPSTLHSWRWSGRGPRFVKLGGRVRYSAADLDQFIDEHTRTSTSDPGSGADGAIDDLEDDVPEDFRDCPPSPPTTTAAQRRGRAGAERRPVSGR
jgi:predicted DNA-binding transcriptional regulator AlpA